MSGKKKELSLDGYAEGLLERQPAYSQASVGPFTRGSWINTHLGSTAATTKKGMDSVKLSGRNLGLHSSLEKNTTFVRFVAEP